MKKFTLSIVAFLAICFLGYSQDCSSPEVAPYTEDFENAGLIPDCWTVSSDTGEEDWMFDENGSPNHVGNGGVITGSTASNGFYAVCDASGNHGPRYLLSPFVDVSGLTTPALSFYEISDAEDSANSQLDVEVWDGAAWNLMATFNTNTSGWELKTINISGLVFTGPVQARFTFSEPTGDFDDDIAIDDVTFDELPTCPNPSTIITSNITDSMADLSWTPGGSEALWNIELVDITAGGIQTMNATETGISNPHMLTSLISANDYEVYIQADCSGDLSDWVGPVSFTTLCSSITPDYSADMSTNLPDLCWDEAGDGDLISGPIDLGSSAWRDGTSYAYGNSNAINLFASNRDEWLLSPLFDLSVGGPYQLDLNVAVTDWNDGFADDTMGSDDEVYLLMTLDGGLSWATVNTWNTSNEPPLGGESYIQDLSFFNGTVQFAIYATEGDIDDSEDYDFHVGRFEVRTIPSCAEPSAGMATSISDSGANISWTVNGSETMWNIELVNISNGETATGTATETGISNPHSLSALSSESDYEFYIQADCGSEVSVWAGPFAFTTQCTTFIAPYTEDFENGGDIPNCWGVFSDSGEEDWMFNENGSPGHVGNDGTLSGSTTSNGFYAVCDASGDHGPRHLVSPFVDVSGLTLPALSFYEISDNEGGANCQLDVEVWDGAAWNLMGTYNTNTVGWEQRFIDISGLTFTGPAQARFTFSELVSDFTDDIAIDDVTFDELPSCFSPSVNISNLTDVTSVFTWAAGGSEDTWEYANLPSPSSEPASGTSDTVMTASFSGLTPETDYDFYIRSDCGGGEFSNWIKISYATLPIPPANNDCVDAVVLTVNTDLNCGVITSGTIEAASASGEDDTTCGGTPNDDVWFSFIATASTHTIDLLNITGSDTDLYHSVWSGSCGSLTNLVCTDPNSSVVGGLTIGNTYLLRVYTWDDEDGQTTNFDVCVGTPPSPPANDDINFAVAITVDEGFCDGTNTNGTNLFGSDSGEADGSCFNNGADNDVWFTFTVPNGVATVNVSTDFTGGTLVDTEIAVYSGLPSSLVELDCSQDEGTTVLSNGQTWNSIIADLAVTVGETYYVQVAGYDTNDTGTFCLDVSTNQVLGVADIDEVIFTYYPNPVNNTLKLNAQNTIESVYILNMLGQVVLKSKPNALTGLLEMSDLETGTYFVKVTIANTTRTVRVIKQ